MTKENYFKHTLNGKELIIEFKNLTDQANGSVWVRFGDTLVLTTCVMGKKEREGIDFFPLTVEYEEKYYAAGKIKSARYIKREGRPSDEAICTARLIDRAIRPRFSQDTRNEVQVIATVLSWDGENDPDILGLLGASIALSNSDIPWDGPVGVVRIGRVEGSFVVNPTYKEREASDMDLVFAGLSNRGELLINMIEGSFKEVEEKVIEDAVQIAEQHLQGLIDFQNTIVKKMGKEKITREAFPSDPDLKKEMIVFLEDRLQNALLEKDKTQRAEELSLLQDELVGFVEEQYPGEKKGKQARAFFEGELNRLFHENVIQYGKRPDARTPDEIRDIAAEVGILPRTHGSGLFTRGQTKALSILTLGAPGDQQMFEGMEAAGKKRFMHHYNFPPYSSGEVKPLRGPGRREIGHGILAEKALLPLIPSFEDFPYTIRIVSEMLSSNGSTSMASISSSSLALMDAGVPMKAAAAGISIGLAQDEKTGAYKILTDIQGPEDHYGDMDFKVAGTRKGITVIQLDVKIAGIGIAIITETLVAAKKARMHILDIMEQTISGPRTELSPYAPRIVSLQINPDKIREVVGPGGKIINEIIDKTGVAIDIQPSGLIFITAEKEEAAQKALSWIKDITREAEIGEVFEGPVKRILTFGAFVEILPGQEGLVHISKLSPHRVQRVEDVVNIGDIVSVKVISLDEQGRINLSLLSNNSLKQKSVDGKA